MRFSYENEIERARYFIIPYSDFTIMRHQRNSWSSQTISDPISYEFKNDFGSLITIDTKKEIAYINFHKYKEDEKSHYYNENCRQYFWLDAINEKYLRFNFSNLFSDAPEINYTLVITPASYYQYLINDYVFFINFYINNTSSEEDMLVYRFTLNDMVINEKDPSKCSSNNSIELPSPDISFFRKEKTKYMFKLMGVTGPKYKDVNFYDPFYYDFLFCFNTCLTCDYRGDEQAQNCTSCYNDSLLQVDLGNCVDSCSTGYFREEKYCKKCSDNCETCFNFTEEGNNHCLSCNKNSKYKYLLNASNYGSNCVESCPKDTILDEKNYICIYNKKEEKDNNIRNLIFYIIIPIISILLIVMILIIMIIVRNNKRKKENEKNIIDNMKIGLVPLS